MPLISCFGSRMSQVRILSPRPIPSLIIPSAGNRRLPCLREAAGEDGADHQLDLVKEHQRQHDGANL